MIVDDSLVYQETPERISTLWGLFIVENTPNNDIFKRLGIRSMYKLNKINDINMNDLINNIIMCDNVQYSIISAGITNPDTLPEIYNESFMSKSHWFYLEHDYHNNSYILKYLSNEIVRKLKTREAFVIISLQDDTNYIGLASEKKKRLQNTPN